MVSGVRIIFVLFVAIASDDLASIPDRYDVVRRRTDRSNWPFIPDCIRLLRKGTAYGTADARNALVIDRFTGSRYGILRWLQKVWSGDYGIRYGPDARIAYRTENWL